MKYVILLINLYKKDFELSFKYKDDLYDFNPINLCAEIFLQKGFPKSNINLN